jgi:hypothetical protein
MVLTYTRPACSRTLLLLGWALTVWRVCLFFYPKYVYIYLKLPESQGMPVHTRHTLWIRHWVEHVRTCFNTHHSTITCAALHWSLAHQEDQEYACVECGWVQNIYASIYTLPQIITMYMPQTIKTMERIISGYPIILCFFFLNKNAISLFRVNIPTQNF